MKESSVASAHFSFPACVVANLQINKIYKWRTSATKHLRSMGLSVTKCIKKGVFQWQSAKNDGSLGEIHEKVWYFWVKMANFWTNLVIFFWGGELHQITMVGLWVTKVVLVARNLKIGGHWVTLSSPPPGLYHCCYSMTWVYYHHYNIWPLNIMKVGRLVHKMC